MSIQRIEWNDVQVQALRDYWAEGLTCSQIARAMGGGVVTRSAVIGKVHRLGLAGRPSLSGRPSTAKAPMPRVRPVRIAAADTAMAELAKIVAPPMVLENGMFMTVETIPSRACRWPIGDPAHADFHFCGNAPKAMHPYCEAHCRIAYQPETPKAAAKREATAQRRGQMAMFAHG